MSALRVAWRSFECRVCHRTVITERPNDPDEPDTCIVCQGPWRPETEWDL